MEPSRNIKRTLLVVFLCVAAVGVLPLSAAASRKVTVEELDKNGQKTAQLIADGKASFAWTTQITVKGVKLEVDNILDGTRHRMVFRLLLGKGKSHEMFNIVSLDGDWYVTDQGKPAGKYRPYEAPLVFPNAYLFLLAADLGVYHQSMKGEIQSVDGAVAKVKLPLSPEYKAQLQSLIGALRNVIAKHSKKAVVEKMKAQVKQAEQMLKDGNVVEIDISTGVLLSNTTQKFSWKVTSFVKQVKVREKDFDISNAKWVDYSNDPTQELDLNNLVMISNSPLANARNARQLKHALDLRLVNLRTKKVRRVPYHGAGMLAGCFSHDRKKVYISGMDVEVGGLSIFEIDLSTGENRKIGQGTLPGGLMMSPTLSRDGSKLLLMNASANLQAQLYVLDLKTDKAFKLGKPQDTAFLSWLDNGQGIVLVSRKIISMQKPTENSVARMDLDGNVKVLVAGNMPLLIPGLNRILFQQGRIWKTCDLEGKDLQLYAGGMNDCSFPTVSPDGKRLLWMQYEKGRLPQIVMQDFGKPEVQELMFGPGLWAKPAWR